MNVLSCTDGEQGGNEVSVPISFYRLNDFSVFCCITVSPLIKLKGEFNY